MLSQALLLTCLALDNSSCQQIHDVFDFDKVTHLSRIWQVITICLILVKLLFILLMRIVNKQSIIRTEKSFIWAKLRTSSEAIFPDYSKELFWRSRVFSTVLYLVRTKTTEQVRVTFLQHSEQEKKKKKKDKHLGRESYHQRSNSILSIPGRGTFNVYF